MVSLKQLGVISLFVYLISFVVAVVGYNKSEEGGIMGLYSNCPDSTKPSRIKPVSLTKLFMVLLGDGDASGNWSTFHYYRAHEIPGHPDFDTRKKTFLYIGGYWDSTSWGTGKMMGLLYKQLGYNVLLLDTLYFTMTSFSEASRQMREVGKHAAEMLATLTTLGLNPETLEIGGLSLGGETMSFVAKNYRKITGRNVSMLVALDASGPCFRGLGPEQRLDPSDADFVLAIITNSEGFGIGNPVGDVSFYVNGGDWQPGEFWWWPCDIMCSHLRAYYLWLSALKNPDRFIAVQCDSVGQAKTGDCFDRTPLVTNTMDLNIDRSKPGIYYLVTSNRYPYGLGKKGLNKRDRDLLSSLY